MQVVVFSQWDKLVALLRRLASSSVDEKTQYALAKLEVAGGGVKAGDRAMNSVVLTGGRVDVGVPDAVPGRARDFVVRLKADAATEVAFTGADAFESDDPEALSAPGVGETKVYRFTETAADVFLVTGRKVEKIEVE